jgi:hypothetical protein
MVHFTHQIVAVSVTNVTGMAPENTYTVAEQAMAMQVGALREKGIQT